MKKTLSEKLRLPIMWLIISIAFTIIVSTVDRKPLGQEGTMIGLSTINVFIESMVPFNPVLRKASKKIGDLSFLMIAAFAITGLVQLIQRKSLFKVDKKIIGLGILYIITLLIKETFDFIPINYRPTWKFEYSFPSSHSFMAVIVFGSSGLIFRRMKGKIWQVLAAVSYILLCLIIGTRFMSGVHWLTDIIGGILYGVTLLSFYKYIFIE